MKAALAGMIAVSVLMSGSGLAMAQSSTTPPAEKKMPAEKPSAEKKMPADKPAADKMSADKMAGKHSVQGEITRVDAKKGWVHVKTSDGTLIVHIPPADLQTVKKGDMVALDLSLKDNGAAPKK